MKKIILTSLLFAAAFSAVAQDRYFTKTGRITFFSSASLEDIEAKNKTVAAVIDSRTGVVQFSVLMKAFEFEKALMQEHFNENYMESDKFPKGEFKGVIVNNGEINYAKDGTYKAKVKGVLTMHGVSRPVETAGNVKVEGGKVDVSSVFTIQLSDYKIKIPSAVRNKLSNSIRVTVDCRMDPLKG